MGASIWPVDIPGIAEAGRVTSEKLLADGFHFFHRSIGISLDDGVGGVQREFAVRGWVGCITSCDEVVHEALLRRWGRVFAGFHNCTCLNSTPPCC
jgi:hypothetical protein